jgi:hypothetical protein
MALDHLTLGRARHYRAILRGSPLDAAEPEIDRAVDGLRRAGQVQELPQGLLTRAWLRSTQGRLKAARTDLAEAQEIAERGPMPLHLADVNLYRARLFHDRAALAEARRLVDKHGYGRRREELADLERSNRQPYSPEDLLEPRGVGLGHLRSQPQALAAVADDLEGDLPSKVADLGWLASSSSGMRVRSFSVRASSVAASVARPGTSSLYATQTSASASQSARTL